MFLCIDLTNTRQNSDLIKYINYLKENDDIRLWDTETLHNYKDELFTFKYNMLRLVASESATYVLYNKRLSQNDYSTTWDVMFTLTIHESNQFRLERTSRVLKHFRIAINHNHEHRHAKKAGHLNIEEPIIIGGFRALVMDKMPGVSLTQHLASKKSMLFEQQLELTLAILHAYKTQVSDAGLIHLDIKPDNIMVDKGPPIKVNFIDYGLSAFQDEEGRSVTGTPIFMSPDTVLTPQTDIFSLGRVISMVWGEYGFYEKCDTTLKTEQLFSGVKGVIDVNRKAIRSTINHMLDNEMTKRPLIDEIISAFTALNENNNKTKRCPSFFSGKENNHPGNLGLIVTPI